MLSATRFQFKQMSIYIIGSIFYLGLLNAALAGKLQIVHGTSSGHSTIDMDKGYAVVNFEYQTCSQTAPDPKKIKIVENNCQSGRKGNKTFDVAEMVFDYEDNSANTPGCEIKTHKMRRVFTLKGAVENLRKKSGNENCRPAAIAIRDRHDNFIKRRHNDFRVCKMPLRKVTMPKGFGTEDSVSANLSANHNTLRFGTRNNGTQYQYDPDNKVWAVEHCQDRAAGKCEVRVSNFVSPLPIMFRNKSTGKEYLAGSIRLNTDGTATIRSHESKRKAYKPGEVFKDAPFDNIVEEDHGVIKIDASKKVNRSRTMMIQALDRNGQPIRTMTIAGRRLMGKQANERWCNQENCFRSSQIEQQYRCVSKTPEIRMADGGNGNVCYSCLGITAGVCKKGEPNIPNEVYQAGNDPLDKLFQKIASNEDAVRTCSSGVAVAPPEPTPQPTQPVQDDIYSPYVDVDETGKVRLKKQNGGSVHSLM